MIGIRKLPNVAGTGGHQEQENHDDAVHGEELVVGIGGDEIGLGREELEADKAGEGATDKEEERDRNQVEDRDPFVVAREQPAEQAILIVEVVAAWQARGGLVGEIDDGGCDCAHWFTALAWMAPAAGTARLVRVCWTR